MCGILAILERTSVQSDQLELLERLIANRGPDHNPPISSHCTSCSLELQLKASILHLRGNVAQKQPVEDEHGNLLLFNGEIYKLFDEVLEEGQSDTTLLSAKLKESHSVEEVADIFSSIDGPFAFVFWHDKLNSLFYGRDIFGRRSLCLLGAADKPLPCAISSVAFHIRKDDSTMGLLNWSEVDCSGFHCLQFNPNGQFRKRIKFSWNIDEIYPPSDRCAENHEDLAVERIALRSSPLAPLRGNLQSLQEFGEKDRQRAVEGLEQKLLQAVERRIRHDHRKCLRCRKSSSANECNHSKVAVAFSGGIDSTILALALDKVLDSRETIDLTTVAFKAGSPDRSSVGMAFKELRKLCPGRNWRLILSDISVDQLQEEREKVIRHLISPCNTVVDDSLGCGCWFISQAKGRAIDNLINDSTFDEIFESFLQYRVSEEMESGEFIDDYTSPAPILLAGMSIDEQLGGYSSHRAAWSSGGIEGVFGEICKQMRRISSRNLGRDDRTLSYHGRDVKLPYLDFDLVSYLNQLPIPLKMNLSEPLGSGPKKILRELAFRWGLNETGARVKRALQFGTRIADLEGTKEHGNGICSRLI